MLVVSTEMPGDLEDVENATAYANRTDQRGVAGERPATGRNEPSGATATRSLQGKLHNAVGKLLENNGPSILFYSWFNILFQYALDVLHHLGVIIIDYILCGVRFY